MDNEHKDTLDSEVVRKDCDELREIADWMDSKSHKIQGDFLRTIAMRHQYLYDNYLIDGVDEHLSHGSFMDDIPGKVLASCDPF